MKAALWATRMPKIYITGEDGGELEFMVSDNPREVDQVDVSNAPILITHLRVRVFDIWKIISCVCVQIFYTK